MTFNPATYTGCSPIDDGNVPPMCEPCGWEGSWDDLLGGGDYCPGCRGEFVNANEQGEDDEE